jgi:outer membrane biosynthesis protein TonB
MTDLDRRRRARDHDLRRRYGAAAVTAALVLLMLTLFGPDRERVRERWDFAGAPGPLKIMPQISIDDGSDPAHQEAARLARLATPPVPDYVVEPDERGTRPVTVAPPPTPPAPDADVEADVVDLHDTVELNLPTPTNPCFHLLRQIYPRYPADASPLDRLAPVLTVKAAFFVGPDGTVQGSYVLESDAGPEFAAVVLKAVDRWLYDPDFAACSDPAGFWNVLTVTFRNPRVLD